MLFLCFRKRISYLPDMRSLRCVQIEKYRVPDCERFLGERFVPFKGR